MIQKISIKNFLSFKEKTVFSFEASEDNFRADTQVVKVAPGVRLLRFAAIYGANASGKSNFLKAVYFLQKFLFKDKDENGGIDYQTGVIPFLLDDKTKFESSEFEITFFVKRDTQTFIKYIYKLIVNSTTVFFEELCKGDSATIVFQRKFADGKFTTIYNFDINDTYKAVFDVTCRKNMSFFATYVNAEQNLPFDLEDLRLVKEYFQNFLPNITGKKDIYQYSKDVLANDKEGILTKSVINGFETSGLDNINDISFKRNEKDGSIQDDYFIKVPANPNVYSLPGVLQSEGTKRYLSLKIIFDKLLKNNSFMIADELETAIHPDLFEKIVYDFLSAEKSCSQLILTTHYSGLMETINNLVRVDAIRFVEKQDDGSSALFSLADFEDLEQFNDKINTIYKAYRDGRFGAVANIKY
ncbi:MAG: AAA family ATPase [Bacteroidales bacterium]|nr:AAA family ATPase [Bacteroidales bacterium]